MKRTALLTLIGAFMLAMLAGTAVAKSENSGPGNGNSGSGSGNSGSGKGQVVYNFKGVVTAVTPAGTVTDATTGATAASDSVTVDVQKGNKAARTFVAANGASQTFNLSSNTKIEVDENEDATLADVQVGDEVQVQVKASATAAAPLTARKLEVENDDD